MTKTKLYIIDGSAYIFRAFFAVKGLSNSEGLPTNALYGFLNMLLKLLDKTNPTHLVVTFDDNGPNFRHEMYSAYKANRKEKPVELVRQLPYFPEIVEAFKIPVIQMKEVEADDVIASLVKKAQEQNLEVVIISADKDLLQLLSEDVTMLDTMRNRLFTVDHVIERFQVGPALVADVMGLAGDQSDNIPGVPGIGEKIGGKLIKQFGSLEAVLSNIDSVSGKKRKENLAQFADQARLSKKLVTLKSDLDITLDIKKFKTSEPNYKTLIELCRKFEFKGFLKRFEKEGPALVHQARERNYETILSQKQLDEAIKQIKIVKTFAVDLATSDKNPMNAEIVGIALSWKPQQGVYIPVDHRYLGVPKQLPLKHVLTQLKPLLEDPAIAKYGQNTKYEQILFQRHDIKLKGILCDTVLASYLLDPGRFSHSLEDLADQFLNMETTSFKDVVGKGRNKIGFDEATVEKATEFSAENADITFSLGQLFPPKLEAVELQTLHDNLELPLSNVLAKMELEGILVDRKILDTMSSKFGILLRQMEKEICVMAKTDFNVNSPQQLANVLFNKLKLDVITETKSGPSTNRQVLEQLALVHPLPQKIVEYRQMAKLKSTYADALPKLINPKTQRIHTNFNQFVTTTGRLSSSTPNLQNIPVRTEMGREIRRAFIASPGHCLLSADYSQIELRILTHISQDPILIHAFSENQDVHKRTAAEILKIDLDDVTKAQRNIGKTINFATIYGMGHMRLSQQLGITKEKAQDFLEQYFVRYKVLKQCLDNLLRKANKIGYTETLLKRRRYLPQLATGVWKERALGERLAVNTPIQGTAADLIKKAMIHIHNSLEQEQLKTKMLLQVHDEIVFEVHLEELDKIKTLVEEKMSAAMTLSIPLKVDISHGNNWAELK